MYCNEFVSFYLWKLRSSLQGFFFLATENNTAINVFVAVNLDALIFVQLNFLSKTAGTKVYVF